MMEFFIMDLRFEIGENLAVDDGVCKWNLAKEEDSTDLFL